MSIGATLFGWIVKPVVKKELNKMVEKYLKPALDFLAGQPSRILILVMTFGALGYLLYSKIESPYWIGAVVISGAWAQWMNYKVQKPTGGKK